LTSEVFRGGTHFFRNDLGAYGTHFEESEGTKGGTHFSEKRVGGLLRIERGLEGIEGIRGY